MQEAVTRMASALKGFASSLVTYAQGVTILQNVPATLCRTPYDLLYGSESNVAYESDDFIIAIADLKGLTPTSGDKIVDANGQSYLVSMPLSLNVYEQFRGVLFKIHSKAVPCG